MTPFFQRLRLLNLCLFCLSLAGFAVIYAADDTPPHVKVTILDWDGTQKAIKAHQGKIVVMDAWSLSCVPCVREFPHLVEMHKKFGDKIACVSLNADYSGIKTKPPEFYREKVLAFLTKQKASFTNIMSSVPSDELFEKLDIASIPAVFVYDASGKLVKTFDNSDAKSEDDGFTYQDVEKYVAKLLESGKK